MVVTIGRKQAGTLNYALCVVHSVSQPNIPKYIVDRHSAQIKPGIIISRTDTRDLRNSGNQEKYYEKLKSF
jgi:hypothetical protein